MFKVRSEADVDAAVDMIIDAMSEDKRHPVTVGFNETRKELREPKRGSGPPKWYPIPGEFVPTVRTMEFFDFDESAEGVYFRGMDRCPRADDNWLRHGPPRIRTIAARRITDLTVHTKSTYRLKNQHFIDRVREHAEEQRWASVARLTDDALWHLIQLASDPDDAIDRARRTLVGT